MIMNSLKLLAVWAGMAAVLVSLPVGTTLAQGGGLIPIPCGAECFRTAMEAAAACRSEGGSFSECAETFATVLSACREDAGCSNPERPPVCGENCLLAARDAARACKDAEDPAACLSGVRTELEACLDAAGCEIPQPPERILCGISCLKDSLAAAGACVKDGGTLQECAGVFRTAFEACRTAENCAGGEEPPPPDEEAEVLALLLQGSYSQEPFIRGDANGDQKVDISDPMRSLIYLFAGAPAPSCMDAADANDDGQVDIADPLWTLSTVFEGTHTMPAPYPESGTDLTEDGFFCIAD